GTYNVTLTATSECGIATSTQSVIIDLVPVAVFGTVGLPTDCAEFVLEFIDQSTNNPTEWSWTFEGGNPATSTEQNPTVVYTAAGTFDVELTVSNAAGNTSIFEVDYITVNDVPTANFVSSNNLQEVSFTNNSTDADSYLWDFGDGNTSTDSDPIHTYAVEGDYTVTLTATNECGDVSSTQSIIIDLVPVAVFGTLGLPTDCAEFVLEFIDESTNNPTEWSWTFEGGNPATSTEQNPTVTYSTPGTFDVSLTVTDAVGMDTNNADDYVVVQGQATADFDYTVDALEVTFDNQSTGSGLTYLWDFGDGNTSTDSDPIHTYTEEGIYDVTLTTAGPCNSDITTQTVDLYTIPTADFSSNITEGCSDLTVVFNQLASNNVTDYAWTFEGGNPTTSTDPNPVVIYTEAGTYNVELVVSNPAGSASTSEIDYITVIDVPTANFVAVNNILTVTFTNNSTGADSYLWDFGDGNTSTDSDPIHTYAAEGDYTVTLTATNECGDAILVDIVSVNSLPSANAFVIDPEICEGEEVQFTDASSDNVTDWLWTFEGGTPATSTEQNPFVIYNTAGFFDVSLVVTAPAGTDEIILENFIIVSALPTSDFVAVNSMQVVTFTNNSIGANSYLWDFGDGNTSTDINPIYTYTSEGTYNVTLTATNECGDVSSTQSVSISSMPTANFVASITEVCEGEEVQFTDASSDNVTGWLWTFEGGTPATSTEQNPFVTYNTVGNYDVSLVVTAPAGTDEIIFENLIIVSALPTSDFVAVNNILTVTFTNNSTGADSYLWDFGDGNTSTDSDPIHTYAAEDDYTVTLTATNECGDVSSTQSVSINSMPTANFVASITEVCEGEEVQFTDASSDNVTEWLWTFEGGTPATSTEQNPLVTYDTPGTYDVTLEVTAPAGTDEIIFENLIIVSALPTSDFVAV
ncbi:PKD domain-containing protein, partial [Saprospiraceae bacterium]|nr:PKD domain-containing protein [Saprospiraceae bacterium]